MKSLSGYNSNQSINVNPECRRLGIATALIDFAEKYYGMDYKPSDVLSSDMEKLIKKRFDIEEK